MATLPLEQRLLFPVRVARARLGRGSNVHGESDQTCRRILRFSSGNHYLIEPMSRCPTEINQEGPEEHEIEIFSSFVCFVLFVGIIYFLRARSTSKFRTYEE